MSKDFPRVQVTRKTNDPDSASCNFATGEQGTLMLVNGQQTQLVCSMNDKEEKDLLKMLKNKHEKKASKSPVTAIIAGLLLSIAIATSAIALPPSTTIGAKTPAIPCIPGKGIIHVTFCPSGMVIQCDEATTAFTWQEIAIYRYMMEKMEAKEGKAL